MVWEIFQTDGDITEMFHPAIVWADVTEVAPQPQYGWKAEKVEESWGFTTPD